MYSSVLHKPDERPAWRRQLDELHAKRIAEKKIQTGGVSSRGPVRSLRQRPRASQSAIHLAPYIIKCTSTAGPPPVFAGLEWPVPSAPPRVRIAFSLAQYVSPSQRSRERDVPRPAPRKPGFNRARDAYKAPGSL
jgi:hypothetical protein